MIKFYFIYIFQSILEDKDVNSTLDWLEMIEKSVVYITVEKLLSWNQFGKWISPWYKSSKQNSLSNIMRLLFKDENSKEQEVEEGVVRSAEDVVRLSPSLTSTTTVVKVLVRGGNYKE